MPSLFIFIPSLNEDPARRETRIIRFPVPRESHESTFMEEFKIIIWCRVRMNELDPDRVVDIAPGCGFMVKDSVV